jgi:hypothetical protein
MSNYLKNLRNLCTTYYVKISGHIIIKNKPWYIIFGEIQKISENILKNKTQNVKHIHNLEQN